ncbi:hypothetical protein BH23BAC1_BH23BAC1_45900 [soil metagenome]
MKNSPMSNNNSNDAQNGGEKPKSIVNLFLKNSLSENIQKEHTENPKTE